MRNVLALALCLLGLTLALNLAGKHAPLPRAAGAGEDGGLDLLLASKPPLRPPGRLGPGEFFDLALVGDRVLVPEADEHGLQLVTLGPGLVFEGRRLLGASDADILARRAAGAQPGTVLVLTAVEPERSASSAWSDTLRRLGARTDPLGADPAGWVFLTARLRTGWVALAEAYSEDSGVALAFTLAPDLSVYRDHAAELHRPAPTANATLHLDREFAHATRTGQIEPAPTALSGGFPRTGLSFSPGPDAPAALRFPALALHPGAAFSTFLGFPDGALPSTDGATCELHLDGEPVARRYLPPQTRGWVAWRVLLKDTAGTAPELTLVTSPGPDATGDTVLWAEPRLYPGLR